MMNELVIATRNKDKERELKGILRGLGIKVVTLDKFPGCPEVREGIKCFKENAIRKAMVVSRYTKKPALADDSGLETDALGGRPGISSARFAGKDATYKDNNLKLLRMLRNKKMSERGAQFRCVVALCEYPRVIGVVEGIIHGKIAEKIQGKNGFGYDPLFLIPKYKITFAQLSPMLKNQISHRARALKRAKRLIQRHFKLRNSRKS